MLSKQTTQGNLQEGATVAMMCQSVCGGLTPTLRAHGGQHSSPAEGDKRVRFPERTSQHSQQLQSIGDPQLHFPEEENPQEMERWVDRRDESQEKMGLFEGIDEALVHSLVFQLVCHHCDKMPGKSSRRTEGFVLAHGVKVQPTLSGKMCGGQSGSSRGDRNMS